MPDRNLNLFKEWRTADRDAHGVEQAVTRASLAALDGQGLPPGESEIAKARKLRAAADDLFVLAMAEMRKNAEANRR